ncbi:MAG: hypothetical protein ACT4PS_13235 [Betaproteobacteria bacterium]
MDLFKDYPAYFGVALLGFGLYPATAGHAQPASKTPPEIVALMPSGIYLGHALLGGKRLDLSLNVQDSKPGGRFAGTVHVRQAPPPCGSVFPIRGDLQPNGSVHIESRAGVTKGCERTFVLTLAGSELEGSLLGSEGTYRVKLKRSQ